MKKLSLIITLTLATGAQPVQGMNWLCGAWSKIKEHYFMASALAALTTMSVGHYYWRQHNRKLTIKAMKQATLQKIQGIRDYNCCKSKFREAIIRANLEEIKKLRKEYPNFCLDTPFDDLFGTQTALQYLISNCPWAARAASVYLVEECKVDVNKENRHGKTVIFDAICRWPEEFVEFLLKNGAIVNVRDSADNTPLFYYLFRRFHGLTESISATELPKTKQMIKLLIKYKVNLDMPNERGRSVRDIIADERAFQKSGILEFINTLESDEMTIRRSGIMNAVANKGVAQEQERQLHQMLHFNFK